MKKAIPILLLALLVAGGFYLYQNLVLPEVLPPAEDDPPAAEQTDPQPEEPDASEEPHVPTWEETAREMVAEMTVEEKVGQLFFVRCPTDGAVEDVSAYHLGGYLLFGRDFQDKTAQEVEDTIAAYQSAAEIPLLIGVDEEGGTVVRASSNPNLFPSRCLSPQALYRSGGMEAIREDAVTKNNTLLSLGVNVNFAPVADVSTDPDDFIYPRAFGQDAAATADYVSAVVTAMGETACETGNGAVRIGSVLKHFPGYGNNVDTHTGISVDQRPYDTFVESDFLPFSAGIAAGADCVLVSHNIVSCMDDSLPASLSPEVHRILREELGFPGVILTDDLAMDAVAAYAEDGSVAVLAVLAGNDMIITTDYRTQIPLVIAAVEDGAIDESLIDDAVVRVLTWKHDLGLIG